MRYALINPPWTFEGSIYFGCREPHLPLELAYAQQLLERAGHDVQLIDAQLEGLAVSEIRRRIVDFQPHFSVITTAPSYLFWRCAPPELRVPQETLEAIRDVAGTSVIIGPHASTTPAATLRKMNADVVLLGEPEEILPLLTGDWQQLDSICFRSSGKAVVRGSPHASDMGQLAALRWPLEYVQRHAHHHHRFDAAPTGPGAEMEASRGCPYHCTFCAKDNFRNLYRRRPVGTVLDEVDGLLAQGVEYIYFIDEIFLPQKELLLGLADRRVKIGLQTRIDLWNEEALEMLGQAHCVSVEAGVESITEEGRAALDKKCKLSTAELTERLIFAKQRIPFVQANLLAMEEDDIAEMQAWRARLQQFGIWSNEPVPLFPYPGSPDYTRRWGAPDDRAWERAHEFYLSGFDSFSDIQEQHPLQLIQLELPEHVH